jgi:hypothetical protein
MKWWSMARGPISTRGWTITRITTDADGSVTATQSATGAWSNKTNLQFS